SQVIAFYNLENFYDTIDDELVNDDEFLPNAIKQYNAQKFNVKLQNMTSIIAQIGMNEKIKGPVLLGVAEIENKQILQAISNHPNLKDLHYNFIHFDSRDPRGIDVALFYQTNFFKPLEYFPISLTDATHFTNYFTRDILYVGGLLNNEYVHIFVNHWSSRRGGEKRSAAGRIWGAKKCNMFIDSIFIKNKQAKIIVMGDFNDNPDDKSIKTYLHPLSNMQQLKMGDLFNPFYNIYKSGKGSIAQNDVWGLFDQIIISSEWLNNNHAGFKFYNANIYIDFNLMETQGKFKGYPIRTWNGNIFRGGYSDHFPTYIVIKK
ncbi:MAG: endonuclease/exonuclease/phosphatase, partial [Sediminibacterium sp.]|nr:endonuclease/exonuclease/phosphatase [Sediminibacterium sp.]